jgi:hypothetical protein
MSFYLSAIAANGKEAKKVKWQRGNMSSTLLHCVTKGASCADAEAAGKR